MLAGRFSVDHALQIERIHANPRISQLLSYVVEVYVERAEHRSFDEFRGDIDEFIRLTDQDGAFADLTEAVEGRNAQVSDVGGSLEVSVSGGDPVTTSQFIAVFESFVYLIGNGALEWGPIKRVAPTAQVSAERTTTSTIRRVGDDGREVEAA